MSDLMPNQRTAIDIYMERRRAGIPPVGFTEDRTPLEKFMARRKAEDAKRKRRPNAYKILKATSVPYRHQHLLTNRVLKSYGL